MPEHKLENIPIAALIRADLNGTWGMGAGGNLSKVHLLFVAISKVRGGGDGKALVSIALPFNYRPDRLLLKDSQLD